MDYNNILNSVVIPLIEKFGTIHYIERSVDKTLDWDKKFDAVSGVYCWKNKKTGEIVYDEPVGIEKKFPVKSVKDSITEQDMVNSLVLATDSKYYIAPVDIVPRVGDVFIDNDVKYSIYYVETLQPANLTVLYTIYCRIIQ